MPPPYGRGHDAVMRSVRLSVCLSHLPAGGLLVDGGGRRMIHSCSSSCFKCFGNSKRMPVTTIWLTDWLSVAVQRGWPYLKVYSWRPWQLSGLDGGRAHRRLLHRYLSICRPPHAAQYIQHPVATQKGRCRALGARCRVYNLPPSPAVLPDRSAGSRNGPRHT